MTLFVVATLAFGFMGVRLVMLQIVDAPAYAKLAADQREREVTFPARRGAIFDRDGEPLAISVDMRTVFADPRLIEDVATASRRLGALLQQPDDVVAERLRGTWPGDRFEYVARGVEPGIARRIKDLGIPGIYIQAEPRRFYPNDSLAGQVIGFANIDGVGLSGVEVQYENVLRGRPGRMVLEQDPAGRPLPQAEFTYEPPRAGRSVFVTVDKDLQFFTERALGDAVRRYGADAGTAIVMRPHSGEILALANAPSFDPNHAGRTAAEAQKNRAVTDVYEPGSIFKIVTASAALEERVVTPQTKFDVPDTIQVSVEEFHDSHAHAPQRMSVHEIIRDSSNVGTIKIGLKLGAKRLHRYVRRFGFGEPTGLDFPGEAGGIVVPPKDWSSVTIATVPIGQGIAVTPLHVATAYATLANEGVWVEPKLVHGTMDQNGRLEPASPPTERRVVSRRTALKMRRILSSVVADGTGVLAQVPGYRIAGKTGTAQKPVETGGYGNSYVASFAGWAPAKNPAVVVVVVLDEPRPIWGGMTAGPTFARIAGFALRHLGISPTGNAAEAARALAEARSGTRVTGD